QPALRFLARHHRNCACASRAWAHRSGSGPGDGTRLGPRRARDGHHCARAERDRAARLSRALIHLDFDGDGDVYVHPKVRAYVNVAVAVNDHDQVKVIRGWYPPAVAEIGEVIGQRYAIVDRIASGGMGAVYRARHLLSRREVALKLIALDSGIDPGATERF